MLRPGGYGIAIDPEAPVREWDTFTCAHCGRIVFVKPRAPASESGGWCGRCAKPTCGPCGDLGRCTPLERRLERMEARARSLRSMGF